MEWSCCEGMAVTEDSLLPKILKIATQLISEMFITLKLLSLTERLKDLAAMK